MSDLPSKIEGLGLQPDDMIRIIFYILVFEVRKGRKPTWVELKDWWRDS